MGNASVVFIPARVSEGDWQIVCYWPVGKIEYVTGFLDERSIKDWLSSGHRDDWLRGRGYQQ
jgi:hypothetical protein